MSAREPWFKINETIDKHLNEYETFIIFIQICEQLKQRIKLIYSDYFQLLKFSYEMENTMLEESLIQFIINDILSTEEYSLSGIAYYTNTPEDIIYDIAMGTNTNPSLLLSKKIIALHRTVRPYLYHELIKKVVTLVA